MKTDKLEILKKDLHELNLFSDQITFDRLDNVGENFENVEVSSFSINFSRHSK
jgi:hypothetical protein